MTSGIIPHICGGVLFDLLLETRKARRKARDKYNGGSDGLTAPALYAGLIYVVTGDDVSSYAGATLEKCASDYKKCLSSSGEYVPFTDPGTKSALHSAYIKKDPALLERTAEFIDKYLNKAKCEWLTRVLIETMQAEESLHNVEIAISYNETRSVCKLHTADTIVFPAFLLSIIHFIMVNRPDCESGRDTFENWYSQASSKSEWKLTKENLGDSIPALNVTFDLPTPEPSSETRTVATPPQSSVEKSDHEVISEQFFKSGAAAAATLVEAIDRLNLPSDDHVLKFGQILQNAFGGFEHQAAERISESQKEAKTDEPEIEAEIVDAIPHADSNPKVVNYIQNQTNIEKQEINNFDLNNAHDIVFKL